MTKHSCSPKVLCVGAMVGLLLLLQSAFLGNLNYSSSLAVFNYQDEQPVVVAGATARQQKTAAWTGVKSKSTKSRPRSGWDGNDPITHDNRQENDDDDDDDNENDDDDDGLMSSNNNSENNGEDNVNSSNSNTTIVAGYPVGVNATHPHASWYLDLVQPLVKSWPDMLSHEWCTPMVTFHKFFRKWPQKKKKAVGLIYSKCPKASSSTGSGITLRIGYKVAERNLWSEYYNNNHTTTSTTNANNTDYSTLAIPPMLTLGGNNPPRPLPCTMNYSHQFVHWKRHANRNRDGASLLWTTVRQPAPHIMSMFFHFPHGRKGKPATDANIIKALQKVKSTQSKYNAPGFTLSKCAKNLKTSHDWVEHKQCLAERLQTMILDYYDFIAITERLDESLVVLKNLWNLELGDLLVSSTKVSGSYEMFKKDKCNRIPKKFISPGVAEYLQSGYHKAQNLDYLLYDVAVASLEATIDRLGREYIADELERYRALQRIVDVECANRTFGMCSDDGVPQPEKNFGNCYAGDMGCGFQCMDEIWEREKHRLGVPRVQKPT